MKKYILGLVTVLALTNCGEKNPSTSTTPSADASVDPYDFSSGTNGSVNTGSYSPTTSISLYNVPAGFDIESCNSLNPVAIKNLSPEAIRWLATIQSSGITLHENYIAARRAGYTGAMGSGQHIQYLQSTSGAEASFAAEVSKIANYYQAGYGTFVQHHQIRRAAGYQGLFLCGGDICFQQGKCDNLGRQL